MSLRSCSRSLIVTGCVAGAVLMTSTTALAAVPNGEARKSPAQIERDAVRTFTHLTSVRVRGTGNLNGTPLTLDLTVSKAASGGTVTLGAITVDIIRLGPTVYLKTTAAPVAGVPDGPLRTPVWAAVSASCPSLAAFTRLLSPSGLLSGGSDDVRALRKQTHLARTSRGPAVVLIDRGDGSKLYVAASGVPLPLSAVTPGPDGGTEVFDRFDAPVHLKAPGGPVFTVKGCPANL